jgi:hypothetical protein
MDVGSVLIYLDITTNHIELYINVIGRCEIHDITYKCIHIADNKNVLKQNIIIFLTM